jgi:hypothetical protein
MKDLDLFLQRTIDSASTSASWANRSTNRSTAACTAPTQDATVRAAPEGLVGVSEDQVAGARVASYK